MKTWRNYLEWHIQRWSLQLGNLGWWPHFVYHLTDIRNAASILQTGSIFSRDEAVRLNLMKVDNASPQIIRQTRLQHRHYIRLYFRPRTPTQYQNEGIRPKNQRELGGAHCPVPIYFCFDALNVLSRDDCEFSDGNMGSRRVRHSSELEFFQSIPFNLVYHHGAIMPNQDKREIIFRRNAEVLLPGSLPLEPDIRFLACRTTAERQTLLELLPVDVQNKWSTRIRLAENGLFERKWTYVEEVVVVDQNIFVRFNPNTITPGPFQVEFTYQEYGKEQRVWKGVQDQLNKTLRIGVKDATIGKATLLLDGDLAFSGTLIFGDIPF